MKYDIDPTSDTAAQWNAQKLEQVHDLKELVEVLKIQQAQPTWIQTVETAARELEYMRTSFTLIANLKAALTGPTQRDIAFLENIVRAQTEALESLRLENAKLSESSVDLVLGKARLEFERGIIKTRLAEALTIAEHFLFCPNCHHDLLCPKGEGHHLAMVEIKESLYPQPKGERT